ncbi:MAG: RdgB/HAM1 family non-canonical purine NTP pyrophosphatase [Verrucomicrobiae bacterium]|nr:RdgB/HAM1 family non-canonical purine NTP pyrophosphatase [Verrucomicrobiae bacterium]
MVTLLIATHNPHKAAEIQSLLGLTYRCRHLAEFSNVPTVIEDGATFAGNAGKKALTLASWWKTTQTGSVVDFILADDSGLEVDALAGAPGVHSARFAALDSDVSGNATDADNNAKLLRLLKGVPAEKRTARFKCVMALLPTHGTVATPELFVGACEGRIAFECRGKGGFGYDPLFLPQGYDRTFAELGAAIKNQLSHRARALEHLKARLEARASAT